MVTAAMAGPAVRWSARALFRPTSYRTFSASSFRLVAENPVPATEANPKSPISPVSGTNATPLSSEGATDHALSESVEAGEAKRVQQAPNRLGVWSRSQQERGKAMSGPRFEQTLMEEQPRPMAAIELIHKQPVRWVKERSVACDGEGGALGHPKIFINVDKPQICWCTYCGVPYAKESNRKHIEALPNNAYPLDPTGAPEEVKL